MVRRSKLDIIWDMLVAIQLAGGKMKPTRLLYKSNLSYNKMQEYLIELREQNLVFIEPIRDKKLIGITDKGHEYVAELRRVRNFAKTVGLK